MDRSESLQESFAYLAWDLQVTLESPFTNTGPLAPWWALRQGMGRVLGINANRPLFLDTAQERATGSRPLHLRSLL